MPSVTKYVLATAGIAASFTVYQQSSALLNLESNWLKIPLNNDYNASGCAALDGNFSANFSSNVSSHIATAVSLVPSTIDCWVTVSASPLYYMSYMIPSDWSENNHETLRGQFYAGGILTAGVGVVSFTGYYYLPELLAYPVWGLDAASICFFNPIAKTLTWTLLPLSMKTWLEQFLFSGGLTKNTWIPSVAASVLSLALDGALQDSNISYYYMKLPFGVESIVLVSHILTYLFNKKIRTIRLTQGVPWSAIGKQIKSMLHGIYAIGLTVGFELAIQLVPVYLASQWGGDLPDNILKSQQNFYLVYMWQVASAITQGIEVFNAKDVATKQQTAKRVFVQTGGVSAVLAAITFAINYCTSDKTDLDTIAYVFGTLYAGSEFVRSQLASIVKALNHNLLAFLLTASTLGLGGLGQWLYMQQMPEQASEQQVLIGLLSIQLAASTAASTATALASCHLFKCAAVKENQQGTQSLLNFVNVSNDLRN